MSSQSFSEDFSREEAARGAYPDARRPRSHQRTSNLSHHKGQEDQVYGGRTAARQQGITDSSRGRGRAVSQWATEVLIEANYGATDDTHPDTVAARIDPRRAEPLPSDHPEVLKEIKRDRIEALMQPGSGNEVDQSLSSGIEGYDDDDDWIS